MVVALLSLLALAAAATVHVPTVTLYNTAESGMTMPAIGLGTGGYNSNPNVGYGDYPECWSQDGGCGKYVHRAVTEWLQVGGRRLDCANSYQNQQIVGQAMADSNIPRKDIFLLSKVGPSNPLGYQDSLDQFEAIKSDMNTSYVDLLLIHWPFQNPSQGNVSHHHKGSRDPACNMTASTFDGKQCRINTWKALLKIYNQGGARAIGVSNWNISCFEEIRQAGLPMPALTQNPYHSYRSSSQAELLAYCKKHKITFLGYSPFGIPDWHKYPQPLSATPLQDPAVIKVAKAHNATAAQVLIAWQWQQGIPVNPRSQNQAHMVDNLNAYGLTLSDDEVKTLSNLKQDTCQMDPSFYECAK